MGRPLAGDDLGAPVAEGAKIDEAAFKALIRAAVAVNQSKAKAKA